MALENAKSNSIVIIISPMHWIVKWVQSYSTLGNQKVPKLQVQHRLEHPHFTNTQTQICYFHSIIKSVQVSIWGCYRHFKLSFLVHTSFNSALLQRIKSKKQHVNNTVFWNTLILTHLSQVWANSHCKMNSINHYTQNESVRQTNINWDYAKLAVGMKPATGHWRTLWGQADLGPSRCRFPCRTPLPWRPPPRAVLSASVRTGHCTAEGSGPAGPPSPSWCTTSPSLRTTHAGVRITWKTDVLILIYLYITYYIHILILLITFCQKKGIIFFTISIISTAKH